ncbi:hypothetical protein ElyMa_006075300 [Elysia marginata]|uniref:Uncharacterized protein n=1 Tax=Elysia marginata TaxID=1093978 RepID=A0AAV4GQG7_9GAST|nr:hypothetical protein ElyMa_006075300 [Elysia marginata]
MGGYEQSYLTWPPAAHCCGAWAWVSRALHSLLSSSAWSSELARGDLEPGPAKSQPKETSGARRKLLIYREALVALRQNYFLQDFL